MMLGIGAAELDECSYYSNGKVNPNRPWYCGPQALAADIYGWFQYGSTPQPKVATPASPSTQDQMMQPGLWTPDDAAAGATPQQSAELTQQAIRDAELAGSYTPSGILPVNASGEVNWPMMLLIAASATAALVLTRK